MPHRGQHHDDANDKDKSPGNNNPSKSVEVTTGSYKKPETYKQDAIEHKGNNSVGQHANNDWNEDTRDEPDTVDSEDSSGANTNTRG